jgi:hypothetical protein
MKQFSAEKAAVIMSVTNVMLYILTIWVLPQSGLLRVDFLRYALR